MENARLDLYLGLFIGLVLGGGLALAVMKVKGLFRGSEARKLEKENAELKKRLEKKDKYIEEMLSHAQSLADNIGAMKAKKGASGGQEGQP